MMPARSSRARPLAGCVVASRQLGKIRAAERRLPAGLRLGTHTHEFDFVTYVIAGGISEGFASRTETSIRHSCRFMAAGEPHSNNINADARLLQMEVPLDCSDRVKEAGFRECVPGELPPIASTIGVKLHMEFRTPDQLTQLSVEALVTELLIAGARASSRRPAPGWLLQARDLLNDCLTTDFSLTAIASELNVHPVHLCREFPRHFQCTMGEYLRRERLKKACSLMRDSAMPLADIALACGFFDQSHFCNLFRRHIGMSPRRYRKSLMN